MNFLKKSHLLLLPISLTLLLANSCDKEITPSEVVEKAFNGVISGNYDALTESVYYPDSLSDEELEIEQNNTKAFFELLMQRIQASSDSAGKSNLVKQVRIVKEMQIGEEAIVSYETTSAGGFIEGGKMVLKLTKSGEWKIADIQNLLPSAEISQQEDAKE